MRSNSEKKSIKSSQRSTRLVIDANILFAALITNNKTSELIFSETLELYAPTFLFEEFEKYKTLLLNKTKRDEQKFIAVMNIFKRNISSIDEKIIKKHLQEAKAISPDPNDTHYFAAAIALGADIWSNDKQLKEQQIIRIITTEELVKEVNNQEHHHNQDHDNKYQHSHQQQHHNQN